MADFEFNSIPRLGSQGSTAFVFDIRNSSKIARRISYGSKYRLYLDFVMKLHKCVYETLYTHCDPPSFALNDTGDGYLCIFWDPLHTVTCMKNAIIISEFLNNNIDIISKKLALPKQDLSFGYAFGIHSGAATINRATIKSGHIQTPKDFIFGIVANTAARLESYTKNYVDYNFLVTWNYRDALLKQIKEANIKDSLKGGLRSLGRVDLKDGKEFSSRHKKGHIIYALKKEFFETFRNHFM